MGPLARIIRIPWLPFVALGIALAFLLANPRWIINIAMVLIIGAWMTGYLSNDTIAAVIRTLTDRFEALLAAIDVDHIVHALRKSDSLPLQDL